MLSLRKRYLALTSNEAVQLRFYEKQLTKLIMRLRNHRISSELKAKGIIIANILLNEMISLAIEPNVSIGPLIDRQRTIESFTASECWNFFETRKEDLDFLRNVFYRMYLQNITALGLLVRNFTLLCDLVSFTSVN